MKIYKTVNWLSAEKSLREHRITKTTVVTLRKKYFFSDQNVDQNDFAQLNFLYAQADTVLLCLVIVCIFCLDFIKAEFSIYRYTMDKIEQIVHHG